MYYFYIYVMSVNDSPSVKNILWIIVCRTQSNKYNVPLSTSLQTRMTLAQLSTHYNG